MAPIKPGMGRVITAVACAAAFCALAPAAQAADAGPQQLVGTNSLFTGTTIALKGDQSPVLLENATLFGNIPIPAPNQDVAVTLQREGKTVFSRAVPTNPSTGRYKVRFRVDGCCDYVAQAAYGTDVSDTLAFEARGPDRLEPGKTTLMFNQLLRDNGFHMGDVSDQVDDSTGLAILALRKTNELPLSESYAPKLFPLLLSGKGRFQPVHDEPGRHVEVDISRQVMALVEDGKATDVFHVSTGAGGTPRGDYNFYEKVPGYNAKGMYYSVFYDGNYATHGYYTVPTYPASHGCVRNPEAYSVFIYNWIDLGDPMYVYD